MWQHDWHTSPQEDRPELRNLSWLSKLGGPSHIFWASLRPKLYRDIEIDSGKSLYDLAEGIVEAFDFDLDHAFGFYNKLTDYYLDSPSKYELFADLEGGESDAGA